MIEFIKNLFKKEDCSKYIVDTPRYTVEVFCSECKCNLRKVDVVRTETFGSDSITHFICNDCETDNYFDMGFMTPLRLPYNGSDRIVDLYKEKFEL